MPIPASHIVQVLPRVISGGSANLELNGLLFSRNPLISASTRVLSFPSAAAAGAYFGTDSVEYEAAAVYFTSFNNKQAAPKRFFVARRIDSEIPAWLRGGKIGKTLAELKSITDGALTLAVDNVQIPVSSVDLSAAQSYSDVAQILTAAIGTAGSSVAATVSYSSLTGAFTVTSATSGAASVLDYAKSPGSGTDLSALLSLTQATGAILSEGSEALDVPTQMRRVLKNGSPFPTHSKILDPTTWKFDFESLERTAI